MALALTLAVAANEEPVTTAEAKAQARVDTSADDTLIAALIVAARQLVEEYTWRSLVTQRWDYYLDAWPDGDTILLPRPPLRSVVTFEYTDDDDVTAAVSTVDYVVDAVSEPGRVRLTAGASWPSATLRAVNGVHVRFEAGYGAASAVPQRYKQAILLLVATWYETRETYVIGSAVPKEVPFAVRALLGVDRARRY